MPNPPHNVEVSTYEHPVQSFVCYDFTSKPDRESTYSFYPLKGKAKNLDRSADPLTRGRNKIEGKIGHVGSVTALR